MLRAHTVECIPDSLVKNALYEVMVCREYNHSDVYAGQPKDKRHQHPTVFLLVDLAEASIVPGYLAYM